MTGSETLGRRTIPLDRPSSLQPGVLTRLGGEVPAGAELAEVPPPRRGGWLPFNVYLLEGADEVIVLDTGPAVLHPALADEVLRLAGQRRLSVLLTRNDPEATGGLGRLIPSGRVVQLHYYGGGGLLEWLWDDAQGPGAVGDLFDTVPIDSDWELTLGPSRPITVFRPPIAVLNTVWVHDPASATLFTSDALGIARSEHESLLDDRGAASGEEALDWLAARFDWIELLDSERLANDLAALLEPLDVVRLCPSHGRIVEGRAAVQRFLATVLAALARAGATRFGGEQV